MLHFHAAASLFTVLLIGASPDVSQSTPYRWLATSELETLLRGSQIIEADIRVSYMRTPEEFHQNGRYVRHADNYEANGKYSFRHDAVCDRAYGEPEVCRKILVDQAGRYWIVGRENPRLLVKIDVKPLR